MDTYKEANKGYKTLNLDGVLFMINDSCDELGQHYDNNIILPPTILAINLTNRKETLSIPYLFVVIPDKSVLLADYLYQYDGFLNCQRYHVDKIKELDFIIDTYNEIQELTTKHNYRSCIPNDSHPNLLSQYAVYMKIITQLNIKPFDYVIESIGYKHTDICHPETHNDLCYPENNGDRDVSNLQEWDIPLVIQKINLNLINYQESIVDWSRTNLEVIDFLAFKNSKYVDVYVNQSDNIINKKIFIFHDSNMAHPYNGRFIMKEWYASHFKETYFIWSTFNQQIVNHYRPDYIIEITMERFLNNYRSLDNVFDETYYLNKYPDIKDSVTNIYQHYSNYGIFEGRYPNRQFEFECQRESIKPLIIANLADYSNKYSIVELFLWQFKHLTPQTFYDLYGWKMGHLSDSSRYHKYNLNTNLKDPILIVNKNFDVDYYLQRYNKYILYPFDHYFYIGSKKKYSPNKWFNEKFYISFYGDVNNSINNNQITSGFLHYALFGYKENRLVEYCLSSCLDACMKDIITPSRIGNIKEIEKLMSIPKHFITNLPSKRIWFFLPTINPDIFFAGYQAYIKLIENTLIHGYTVGLYLTDCSSHLINYFMYHYPNSPITKNIDSITICSKSDLFTFNCNDIFVVYTCQNAICANRLLDKKFIFFIQEYEPIFFRNDAHKFILESSYKLPYYAIFNSHCLRNFFNYRQIGQYDDSNSFVFEHVFTKIPRTFHHHKRLIFYARPESHAERNLFEIGIIALKRAIEKGYFKNWIFEGFGSLSGPYTMNITMGIPMKIYPKINLDSYRQFLTNADIGLSLMYAPHPGIVHYEMEQAGLIVVINTYKNRNKDFYSNSPRFVPVEPSIDDLVNGLIQAEQLSYDEELRTTEWIPFPNDNTWDNIFSSDHLSTIFNSV